MERYGMSTRRPLVGRVVEAAGRRLKRDGIDANL
jgi:hypothetical protein